MRQETYRFALDEASAELRQILEQFEELRLRKEQLEVVVEALKPFVSLQSETAPAEAEIAFAMSEAEQQLTSEPAEFTFMQISGPSTEPVQISVELPVEPVLAAVSVEDASPEQVAYFRQPSADPFQRRIDDALWGWQQRPEGLLSPI
jgi:hypothetical protein